MKNPFEKVLILEKEGEISYLTNHVTRTDGIGRAVRVVALKDSSAQISLA